MKRRGQRGLVRVTRGELAGVCGLIIAGMNYDDACAVIGRGRKVMRDYVPKAFRSNHGGFRRSPAFKAKIRDLYENGRIKLAAIAYDNSVGEDTIVRWAREENWKRRSVGRKPASWYEARI